jgi:hypothetical protein
VTEVVCGRDRGQDEAVTVDKLDGNGAAATSEMCHFGKNMPLCRHHHKCKQRDGWTLEQPEPGVLVWCTPAGRTYTTPTVYAV